MKKLAKKISKTAASTLKELRSHRDRRQREKLYRKMRAQEARKDAIFELRSAKNWQPK